MGRVGLAGSSSSSIPIRGRVQGRQLLVCFSPGQSRGAGFHLSENKSGHIPGRISKAVLPKKPCDSTALPALEQHGGSDRSEPGLGLTQIEMHDSHQGFLLGTSCLNLNLCFFRGGGG